MMSNSAKAVEHSIATQHSGLNPFHFRLPPHPVQNIVLATIAGAVGAVAGNPFYTLKTRFQAMSTSADMAVGHQHNYAGLTGAFRDIYRTEGLRGYWRGVNVFVPRVVAYR